MMNVFLICGLFLVSASSEARESKKQRQENALRLRSLINHLYMFDLEIAQCKEAGKKISSDSLGQVAGQISFMKKRAPHLFEKLFQDDWKSMLSLLNWSAGDKTVACLGHPVGFRAFHFLRLNIRHSVQKYFVLDQAPQVTPNFDRGDDVLRSKCGACHLSGGPMVKAKTYSPQPILFDTDVFKNSSSPVDVYHFLFEKSSVPQHEIGTFLTANQAWDLAFSSVVTKCEADKLSVNSEMKVTLPLIWFASFSGESLRADVEFTTPSFSPRAFRKFLSSQAKTKNMRKNACEFRILNTKSNQKRR